MASFRTVVSTPRLRRKTSAVADAYVVVFTAIAIAAVSCGESSPAAPSTQPVRSQFTVSGTVFEIAGHEQRPLAGAVVERFIEQNGTGVLAHVATSDAQGRDSIADVPSGTPLALVVASRLQPCAAVTTAAGNSVLDIHVLRSGVEPTPHIPPVLSGFVFHTIDGAKRPYRDGASVSFFSSSFAGGRGVLARTVTDDEGRFELCGLPLGPGTLFIGASEAAFTRTEVNVQGDAAVEVEVPPAVPIPPPAPAPNIDGTYTLRFDSGCTAIPAELRSRTYTAVISGSPNVVAQLSGSSFRLDPTDGLLNAFSGSTAATPDTVVINVFWPPPIERWGIVEEITSATFLEITGRGTGVINGSVIEGTIAGGIGFGEDLRDDARHTGCVGPIRFQMIRH